MILAHKFNDGDSLIIQRNEYTKLVVNYSSNRAWKDMHNRIRGINKLEKAVVTGKLNKTHINNRGYNKYLRIEGEIDVSIDYEKFKTDGQWDELKGYLTKDIIFAAEEAQRHLLSIFDVKIVSD